MKRPSILLSLLLTGSAALCAQNVSIDARGRQAKSVFKELVRQTGKNFVYSSDLLKGMKVTLHASDEPLESVLRRMLADTDISFSISGNNVMLRRSPRAVDTRRHAVSGYVREQGSDEPLVGALVAVEGTSEGVFTNASGFYSLRLPEGESRLRISYPGFLPASRRLRVPDRRSFDISLVPDSVGGTNLQEVVVTSDINNTIAMRSADVGHVNLNITDIRNTPVILGEADVIKTLQFQPGVSQGMEGMAGMYVHGGGADENLVLLDGVPLYQADHFGGLFSAFNVDVIKNVDFYKSTFPACYGGRLSSVLDVHTKDGSTAGHHGSLRIGLTSGAFNIDGPITKNTTYSFAIRRSWYEILSVPGIAIYNKLRDDDYNRTVFRYAFSDINAKITHRFKGAGTLRGMFYYGEDYLRGGEKTGRSGFDGPDEDYTETSDVAKLHWGNILGTINYTHPFSSSLFGEFSFSVSHFSSSIRRDREKNEFNGSNDECLFGSKRTFSSSNNITDLISRAAFSWNASTSHLVNFGAEYVRHYFKPQESATLINDDGKEAEASGVVAHVTADEGNLFISDDWDVSDPVRISLGLRGSLYRSEGVTHPTLDPRAAVRWAINDSWSVKGAYACMTQYVHQLSESFLALPTDQWIPIAGDMKPQRSHNISLGAYFTFGDGYTLSAEGYWRWLRNVVDYPDYYYLAPKDTPWTDLLSSGKGRARGLDFSLSKSFGKISGHVAYSLLWSDRKFTDKNGGEWYPDRFDNRHKINIMVNWNINDRWDVNAAWTGMSGNRYTLQTSNYMLLPDRTMPFLDNNISYSVDFSGKLNSRRLPFYHRLDLSANLHTKHGMWTFSLYNAYCNMNVVTVRKELDWESTPEYNKLIGKFTKYRLLPTIPGVSYTWYF